MFDGGREWIPAFAGMTGVVCGNDVGGCGMTWGGWRGYDDGGVGLGVRDGGRLCGR